MLGSTFHPTELVPVARAVEENGYSSIWSTEDYFATGGFAGAATVLASTEAIKVGTGLVSVYARHPGLLAMEAGTLASVHPGRFTLGVGVGGLGWLDQQGIEHRRPLGAVRGSIEALRALLSGETVTGEHGGFTFDGVHLEFPPPEPPPIHLGATGPKMTALAGEVSDGLILSVFSTPEFVRIERDIMAANGGADTPITTLAFLVLGETIGRGPGQGPAAARSLPRRRREHRHDRRDRHHRRAARARGEGWPGRAWPPRCPTSGWTSSAVCGDLDACVTRIQALLDAGSDEVALAPLRADSLLGDIQQLGSALSVG